MRLNRSLQGTRRLALAFALVLLSIVLLSIARPPPAQQPEIPAEIKPAVTVVLEDQGKILVEHGSNCGTSDREGVQNPVLIHEKLIIPGYANQGTVILNGWFAEYLYGDEHVRDLSSEILNVSHVVGVEGNVLTWIAKGWLRDDNFDNPYRWCYTYTALAWNTKLIDALAWNGFDSNGVLSSTGSFGDEETALVTLEPYILAPGDYSPLQAVLPRGFGFGWNNDSRTFKLSDLLDPFYDDPVDHHLLQIAYNLNHTELFIRKGQAKHAAATYDRGAVSWVTHGIFKDDDAKRNFWFREDVSTLTGNDVGVVHPPFAIRPKTRSGAHVGGGSRAGKVISTEKFTVEGVPFEYAVPVLTGWDLYYGVGGDQRLLKAGVWLHDIKYDKKSGAATGTLSYSLSAVLTDDDGDPPYEIRHRATILGLVKTGAPAADLVPVLSDAPDDCRRDSNGRLLVTVKNQGSLYAGPSLTTVLFATGTYMDVATPAIDAGATTVLQPIVLPSCFTPNCKFRVTVDSKQEVKELMNESNNVADGQCIG